MTPSILIVDDEPVNRRLARAILMPLGYRFREAGNAEAALEEVHREIPDLILLDVVMPGRSGYDVCRKLKQDSHTKLVPIIMLTALNCLDDRIKGIEYGVDEFLTKPFNATELVARVRALLALKHFTDELENAAEVLKGIAAVAERRDAYTSHHCKRVGDYGAMVAIAMKLGSDDVRAIRLAGMLHDLGKIGVPDHILCKPGPLSFEEQNLMQRHASDGARLLAPMHTMQAVIPFVRHHHEKLDGSGYPDGLCAAEIPLAVRILSVADIYDALNTQRPYKPALEAERCIEILREEARRGWWDLDVVNTLAEGLQIS